MLVKTFASAVQGIDARSIIVEVNTGGTVAASQSFYNLVGLPDKAVQEGFQRIEAAFSNTGYKMMRVKTVVNMAPADIKKAGSSYDLPIAIGILAATNQIKSDLLGDYVMMGELALDGKLRPIKGSLPIAIQARKDGYKGILVPKENAKEAAIVDKLEVYGIESIVEAAEFIGGERELKKTTIDTTELFNEEVN